MPLPLDREKTQKLSEELENVIAAHLAWFKQFNRVLVCGGSPADFENSQDAHLQSPFGKWYYSEAPHPLADHIAFQELANVQQALHVAARQALDMVARGQRPSAKLHDQYIDLALKINNKLRHLQLEIIGDLLSTDTLTGCYSRRGMISRLQAEQERAGRIQRPCCIGLMDFDRFKRVNDELGHPAGDAVLRQGMRFVASVLRKYDTVFRYGGEEFLFCLPSTPLKDAEQVIERIRMGLELLPIMLPNKQKLHITASFGLAEVAQGKPVEDAIALADEALLQAKANGRNRVELWQPEPVRP
ncbi:MAG: diguanylate cyclase [Parasulfuritortus sp.]|jgi:diguanylate cyclase (GGDEF)-like protein|nr:diguanylate cyclase [Parasulfuritortus sp.]